MSILSFIFVAVVIPILFMGLTWVAVTAYRVLFPEEGRPYEEEPVVVRQKATAEGTSVPVGAREIREDQRYLFSVSSSVYYSYAYGESDGIPEIWIEDLWRRQN